MDPRRAFGNRGEREAETFLKKKGYRMLGRQFRTRAGEIDLIAKDGNEIVFVEVKARTSSAFGYPEEAVTHKKLIRMQRAAHFYLKSTEQESAPHRFDIVAIEYGGASPSISHLTHIGDGSW